MTNDIVKKIKEAVVPELELMKGLAAAYLFGSSVKGKMTERSDIDIALLFFDYDRDDIDKLDIMARLSSVTGRDVDLVILNDASPLIYHEILISGRMIFERNRHCRIQREVINRRLYEDYRHIHGIYMQGMRKRHV